jgi:diguanylate cyclase (GGDEF)-like protein
MTEKPSNKPRSGTGILNLVDESDAEPTETKIRSAKQEHGPASARDKPFLLVISGGNLGEMFPLREAEIIIGRGRKGTTIQINDDGISRRHAKLTCAGSVVHIEDLGSANGTIVNGSTLKTKYLLKDGDKITLGTTTILKFTYTDDLEETFQRRMLDAALRDGLTKAFNKKYLLQRLGTEIAFALRHKTPLSLIMLDVDHFKRINDTFGHPVGDTVLVRVAEIVSETVRKEDVFARYGGEEFAVLCRSVDVKNAAILAERLRERLAATRVEQDGESISVTISLGVAGYPDVEADTPEKLLGAADEALYDAKSAGRNRVAIKR